MLPPMLQISNDDGSGGYHNPYSATAFFTSAFNSPGCTTAVRVTGSTVISRIFSVLNTMPPVTAVAPPDSPVPAPRGTTAILLAVAHRITVCTSSVRWGRTTAIAVPASGSNARSCRYDATMSGSVTTTPPGN